MTTMPGPRGRAFRLSPAVCFFLAAALLLPCYGRAQERITDFAATITVNEDASLLVRERIRVNIEGNEIKRGIFRFIPVEYRTDGGGTHHTTLDVISVTLDGAPVPFSTRNDTGHKVVVIGDPNAFAPHGSHVYELAYRAGNQLRFLPDRVALYWNVTGNFWDFPIDRASARVVLPDGAEVVDTNAYTGPSGSQAGDFEQTGLVFASSRPFAAGEGLTIAVDVKNGVIVQPSALFAAYLSTVEFLKPAAAAVVMTWKFFFAILTGNLFGALLAALDPQECMYWLAVVLLNLAVWFFFGRDAPEQQAVVPFFHPPKDREAGFMAVLKSGKTDLKAFSADIMGLAVKKALYVEDRYGSSLKLRDRAEHGESSLLPGEKLLYDSLFGSGETINSASGQDAEKLRLAYNSLESGYGSRVRGYFSGSTAAKMLCIALFVGVTYYAAPSLAGPAPLTGDDKATIVETALCMGLLGWLYGFRRFWRPSSCLDSLVIILLAPSPLMLIVWAEPFTARHPDLFWSAFLGAIILGVFVNVLLKKRSAECVRERVPMKGLELYIRMAEKDRLAVVNAPGDSIQEYERLLPYAIALDCAAEWEKRFAPFLESVRYDPDWRWSTGYERSAGEYRPFDVAKFATSAADTVDQIIDAHRKSLERSSSSSFWGGGSGARGGGSGGGRSGGGGGGGGGGGW